MQRYSGTSTQQTWLTRFPLSLSGSDRPSLLTVTSFAEPQPGKLVGKAIAAGGIESAPSPERAAFSHHNSIDGKK